MDLTLGRVTLPDGQEEKVYVIPALGEFVCSNR